MTSNNYKYEEDSSSLSLNTTIFQCADKIKLRIPTSCGRLGECHECIVEILNGKSNLSNRTEEEMFLKDPFRLACQAKIVSTKEKLDKEETILLTTLSKMKKFASTAATKTVIDSGITNSIQKKYKIEHKNIFLKSVEESLEKYFNQLNYK